MPHRIHFIDTGCCDVCSRHVQRIWRDVVQQLQRGLRMPDGIHFIDAGCCDVCSRHVQRIWCDDVQQL
jgi:hypothetical protein